MTVNGSCHCGKTQFEVTEAPASVTTCTCSLCAKRGALWAYYKKDEVRLVCEPDATSVYIRGPRRLEFHRCKVCGLTTHWVSIDPARRRMGVNGRLMPRKVRALAPVYQG